MGLRPERLGGASRTLPDARTPGPGKQGGWPPVAVVVLKGPELLASPGID